MDPDPKDGVRGCVGQGCGELCIQLVAGPPGAGDACRVEFPHQHGPGREGNEPAPDQIPTLPARLELQEEVSLLLPHLGEAGTLRRSRVEDGHGKVLPLEIPPEDLMAMNVAREDGSAVRRQVGAADHVRGMAERVVAGTHRSSLHAMMEAEQAQVGFHLAPARVLQHLGEPLPDPVTVVGKARHGYPAAPDVHQVGSGPAKDVEVRMRSEPLMRDPGTLVVPRHNEDRHPGLRHLRQEPEGIVGQGGGDPRPVEEVAAVDHQVHSSFPGRLHGRVIVRPQVVPPPPSPGPGSNRQIESQVGVGQEEDPDERTLGWHGVLG